MDPDIEEIRAGYAILQDEFEKIRTMTASAFKSLDVQRDGPAHPRTKQHATARRQHDGSDAAAGARAVLLHLMEAHTRFEDHLRRFSAKIHVLDSGGTERIPDSHQAAPNPADENATPASHPASDPNVAEKGWIPASSLVHPDAAEVDCISRICPDDCDTADEPQTASPGKTEEFETSDVDDASQDTASSDPSSPPLPVDCDIADVEAQTASSEIEERETASVADANQDTTSIDLPSPRPPSSQGPRTPLPSSPTPGQDQTLQAPQMQDKIFPTQNQPPKTQEGTPETQDETLPTPNQTPQTHDETLPTRDQTPRPDRTPQTQGETPQPDHTPQTHDETSRPDHTPQTHDETSWPDQAPVHVQDEHIETPTAQEFHSFLSLYTRVSRQYEPRGFVLIRIPSAVLGSCSTPTQPQIATSWRQTLHWKSELVASVEYEEVRHDPLSKWQIADLGQEETALSAFTKWCEMFGPGGCASLPNYATNISVRDREDRRGVCLPETSPVYPLAGNVLLHSAPETQGLTTPEAFCSEGFGTVFTLHTEDFDAPSINVNHSGSGKLWVVIPRDEHQKLMDALDRDGVAKRLGKCHQYVRHESLFLHPRYLNENRIQYRCFVQPPGIAVLVFPGAAHYGFNLGPNLAEAVNYVPEGWAPPTVKQCACSPEQKSITRRMFLSTPKRTQSPRPATAPHRNKRVKRHHALQRPSNDDPQQWLRYITSFDSKVEPPPQIRRSFLLRYVLALWSRQRLLQIHDSIQLWKNNTTAKNLCDEWRKTPQQDRVRARFSESLASNGHLNNALGSVLDVLISREIRKRYSSGSRLGPGALYKIFNIPETDTCTHDRIQRKHQSSCKLDELCEKDLGLLFLLPHTAEEPFHVTIHDYARLPGDKAREFQRLVKKSEIFCTARRAASAFLQCALEGGEFPVGLLKDLVAKLEELPGEGETEN